MAPRSSLPERPWRSAGGAVLALLLAAPGVAGAQVAEVERLLRRGVELRQQGDSAAALVEFERAHRLAGTPRTLAQVALCEQALGRWVDAEAHLREALRSAADPWIVRNRAPLDGALGVITQHVGQVVVRCDVDGAAVRVAGRDVGACPLPAPVRVEAGEVEVGASLDADRAEARVRVTAGDTSFVTLALRRTPPSQPLAPPAPRVTPPPTLVLPPAGAAPPANPTPGSAQRTWGWVTLVGGVIGLGVGVGGVFYRDDGARAYNGNVLLGQARNARCPGINHPTQPAECADYLRQVDVGTAMQWAGLAGGGVLALTGILLLATAPSSASAARAAIGCGSGPGELGVACAGSF